MVVKGVMAGAKTEKALMLLEEDLAKKGINMNDSTTWSGHRSDPLEISPPSEARCARSCTRVRWLIRACTHLVSAICYLRKFTVMET